jgi:3-dehydroquinate dehydratase type II
MQSPSRVLVLNGPNLNMLGTRQPDIYGSMTLADLEAACRVWGAELGVTVDTLQSNHEGAIIDRLHLAREDADAIIINPGAFTHYSYAIFDALEAVELPTVEVHISDITRREAWRRRSVIAPACVRTIFGRGTIGYRDALRHLVFRTEFSPATLAYGPEADQVGDLRVPPGPGPHPVAALIHGGFWREPWRSDLMDGLAVDLTSRGIATWNIEYRRGPDRWRDAFSDTAGGVDHLTSLAADFPLDLDRVAAAGHSAGAQLALWVASRSRLPDDSRWALPAVPVRLAIALAGIVDLGRALDDQLGNGAVEEFFGGRPPANASPHELLPLGVPQLVAHGTADDRVPVAYSRAYVEAARTAGDTVHYLEFENADHFELIDQRSAEWNAVASVTAERLKES